MAAARSEALKTSLNSLERGGCVVVVVGGAGATVDPPGPVVAVVVVGAAVVVVVMVATSAAAASEQISDRAAATAVLMDWASQITNEFPLLASVQVPLSVSAFKDLTKGWHEVELSWR